MNSIKELFEIFVGSYEPITYVTSDGLTIIPAGLAGVDFCWVFGALIVVLGMYSIFRVIGIIISKF